MRACSEGLTSACDVLVVTQPSGGISPHLIATHTVAAQRHDAAFPHHAGLLAWHTYLVLSGQGTIEAISVLEEVGATAGPPPSPPPPAALLVAAMAGGGRALQSEVNGFLPADEDGCVLSSSAEPASRSHAGGQIVVRAVPLVRQLAQPKIDRLARALVCRVRCSCWFGSWSSTRRLPKHWCVS
jgi:hypothetical protein